MPKGKGNGAGRPKIYDEKFILALIPKLESWCKDEKNFWLGDFAIQIGLWRQRLDEFAELSPKFSDTLKRAKAIQEYRLIKLGLDKNVNGVMAIFALKNVAGWRDQQSDQVPMYFNITIGTNGKTRELGESVTIGRNGNGVSAVN